MIEPKYETLTSLFSNRVFRVPSYQRFYSWGRKQREDLFGDILGLSLKGEDRHHFMATVVCFRTKALKPVGGREYRIHDIVDGQQRLTTVILLLKAIETRLKESDDKKELARTLVKADGNLLLLQTNNSNQRLLNDYLKTGQHPSKDRVKTYADKNLRDAIRSCDDFVNEWVADEKELVSLLRLVLNRLGFVIYDTDDNKVVYSVFEVLNSRGLAVDWLDKTKSALMGQAFELSKTAEAGTAKIAELHDLWGKLYERLALHPVSGQEVLRIAATIKLGDEAGKPLPAESALEKFRGFCNKPDKTVTISQWLYDVADELVSLQDNIYREPVTRILQARVLAVALMLCETLTVGEREKCLQQWERVTFRIYGLFGKDARTKVGEYVRLAKNIINKSKGASRYSEIMKSLRQLGADHPVAEAVDTGLKEANCYEGFAEDTRYVLWRYEEHLAQEAGAHVNKEFRDQIWKERSATDSIEHVFPQNPESGGAWDGKLGKGKWLEDHVHRIGNLILLAQPLNTEAKRQGFAEKKNIYAKSEGLRLVREVMQKRDWNLKKIEERESKILRWAKTEWADVPD